ncbi:MAG: hypothetical protein LBH51_10235 [Treponema sp.]|jgi:hypothetical protein|nr:hypothetical protein [Treponema sp.]
MERAKKEARLLLAGLAGALLNFGAMLLFQNVLCIPLFMDTMFTVAFTFLGGLPWGLAVAVFTHLLANPLLSIGLPLYFYILCNVLTAVITAVFMRLFPLECSVAVPARRRIFERVAILFVLSLAMCVAVSLLGGLIGTVIGTFFTLRDNYDAETFIFRRMLERKGLPLFAAEVLCRIPVNIIDRLVSVFGAYGFAAALTAISRRLFIRSEGSRLFILKNRI